MTVKDFNDLHLEKTDLVKITLSGGQIIKGILLEHITSMQSISVLNLEVKKSEEYIMLESIEEIKKIAQT